ncbi:MFS transporter [Temperatibacter marinus]|uniref:MFS transporter n=1 Tax=Temperatibacter marinus TaxID=1456591 RepID=A0AA52EF17_9PROT|nr:MFS transporter [Temperatibacter marinus]WND01893.1 MFS transporter [Temperatibacter marinus]
MGDVLNKNVGLLILSQAIAISSVIGMLTFGPVVGAKLAPAAWMATFPVTSAIIGSATSTGMMSLFMDKFGRRMGFRLGSLFGFIGSFIAVQAIFDQSFYLFCFGMFLFGVFQASGSYFRFAAAESVKPDLAPKAISYVLVGSVFAGVIAPIVSRYSLELFPEEPVVGAFAYAAIVMLALQIPYALMGSTHKYSAIETEDMAEKPARSLSIIMKQKAFWVALVNCSFGYAMMGFVMTATPLAMTQCGFTDQTNLDVISMHSMSMFLPGLITGTLIIRFGVINVLTMGHIFFALAFLVALMGIEYWHFTLSMILLGIAWNFCFVAGSSLLTKTYRNSERGKVQGLNETAVVVSMALASLGVGYILMELGWQAVNQIAFSLLIVAIVITVLFRKSAHDLEN